LLLLINHVCLSTVDPPTSAAKFFHAAKALPLSAMNGVKFSMMAIGSRVYPDFCQAGINLDKWFRNAGAVQLMPLRKADELDDQAGTVNQWINSIGSHFNVEQKKALLLSGDGPTSASQDDDEGPPVTVDLVAETDEIVRQAIETEKKFGEMASGSDIGPVSRFLPIGFRLCRVTRNSELVDFSKPGAKDAYKPTRFLEFDLAGISTSKEDSAALVYETGDHAKLLPANFSAVVDEMCNCLGLTPAQWVNVKIQEGTGRQLTASVARVHDILSYEIDLATQDSDGNWPLLQRLLDVARVLASTDSENLGREQQLALKGEISRLDSVTELLAGKSDRGSKEKDAKDCKKAAITHIMENFLDVPAILKEYPIAASKLSLADCIETLPRLKPRYYSIASATELHPSRLQLTVGVLTVIHKSTSKARSGLCSNYLFERTVASPGTSPSTAFVRLGVNTSSFRLSSDLGCPVIMVGPGTGISPMMGFLQAREKAKADGMALGPCLVFFGCRTECDFLHKEQMRAWEKSGVISSLQVAFSRMPGKPKEYVQHRICKIQDKVWSMLKDDKCHYYVCGDSNMAEDVYEELFRTAQEAGGLDHKQSWEVFQKMKVEHRFQNDTWGVVSGRAEGLARQAEKKYNQAAAWLEQVVNVGVEPQVAKADVEQLAPVDVKAEVKQVAKADVKEALKAEVQNVTKADVKTVAKTEVRRVSSAGVKHVADDEVSI
jgi:sulfite reductase alpha subunit-like flavoprotein